MKIAKRSAPTFSAGELELLKPLMTQAADQDDRVSSNAISILTQGLTMPLQQGVLDGNIFDGLFEAVYFEPGKSVEFPYDLLAPGDEHDYVAYVIPRFGALPERSVESDFCMVPLYEIGSSIDCSWRYMRDARWDILGRMLEIIEASFTVKMNRDAWRVIIRSGVSRNVLVSDTSASPGLFSRKLVTDMSLYMRRYGGGNSASQNRGKLTDLFLSPEGQADTLHWQVNEIPDAVRAQIYANGVLTRIGETNLHALDELGVGQEFESFWDNTLAQDHTNSKVELVVGLDLSKNSSLMMPWREMPKLYEDRTLAKQRRVGIWGTAEIGFTALDNRVVLLGQF